MLTLDQLRVFHSIVEAGSFRAASLHLHRAQSAVSYAIQQLEEELGIELFSRTGYRAELTLEGKRIYEKSLSLLSGAEELRTLSFQLGQGIESEIRIAISALFPLHLITQTLSRFSKLYPHTQLQLNSEVLGAEDRIRDQNADIAISEISQPDPAHFESKPLLKIEMIAVSSPHHPLAQLNKIPRSELLKEVQIVIRSSTPRSLIRSAGVTQGSPQWRVNDFSSKRELLKGGLGWGYMPKHWIEEDLKKKKLVPLKMRQSIVQVEFALIRLSNKSPGPAATQLWSELSATCKSQKKR